MQLAHQNPEISEHCIVKFPFSDRRFTSGWRVTHLWLGSQWLCAARHKQADPIWTVTDDARNGFWRETISTNPKPVIIFDWYRQHLQFISTLWRMFGDSKDVIVLELAG